MKFKVSRDDDEAKEENQGRDVHPAEFLYRAEEAAEVESAVIGFRR